MVLIREYRLGRLALGIAAALGIFLGFFYIWVLAPALLIGGFYLVYTTYQRRQEKKERLLHEDDDVAWRLAAEAEAREEEMKRQGVLGRRRREAMRRLRERVEREEHVA